MTDAAKDFCLQYLLRRHEIEDVAARYADAYDEDLVKNADMFDVTRLTFTQNKHPNRTMRILEDDLRETDPLLLYLLAALCEVGNDLIMWPDDFATPAEFADAAADAYARLAAQAPRAAQMAQKLTEIKAEHACKRLRAAIQMMDQCV